MKRTLLILGLFLCGLAPPAFGQNSAFHDIILDGNGHPLPGVQVAVCSMPAVTTTTPCSPLITIYSDLAGANPIPNPTASDGFGNYAFTAPAGSYVVQTFGPTVVAKSTLVTLGCNPGSLVTGCASSGVAAIAFTTIGHCVTISSISPPAVTDAGSGCSGGGGSGSVIASPPYSIFNQPNPTSSATAQGSNIVTDATGNNLYVPGSNYTSGPNPWIDTLQYNMRAVTTDFTAAASISATTTNLVFSGGSYASFVNGDGIMIPGAGPAPVGLSPPAITITPCLLSGIDTMNDCIAGPAGSTTYSYSAILRDKGQGYTAAGATATTTTGWSALGALSATITSGSRSGNVVSVVLATALPCAVGAVGRAQLSSDASFSGDIKITSCNGGSSPANTTTLTYTQGYSTTQPIPVRAGPVYSTNAETGGTFIVYSANKIVLPTISGNGYQYFVYTAGSSFRGFARPGEASWIDFGAAAPTLPAWFPATAPSSGQNDSLATTIVSGAPTANVVVAAAATNTVTGVTAYFDDAPTWLNACNAASSGSGAGLRISTAGHNLFYYFNSHTSCGSGVVKIVQGNAVFLNETQELNASWSGLTGGQNGNDPSFGFGSQPIINVVGAYPGLHIVGTNKLDHVSFGVNAQGLGWTFGNGGNYNMTMEYVNCQINGTDIVGSCAISYGIGNMHWSHVNGVTNNSSGYGYSITPIYLFRNDIPNNNGAGDFTCDHCFMVGRGAGWESSPPSGADVVMRILDNYNQNVVGGAAWTFGPGNNPMVIMERGSNDSSIMPMLANWGTELVVQMHNVPDNSDETGGAPGIVTGNLITNLVLENIGAQSFLNTAAPFPGQNINVVSTGPQCLAVNMLCTPSNAYNFQVNGNSNFEGSTNISSLNNFIVVGGFLYPTVQSAVTALGSNPGTVIVPPGTWASTSGITITHSGQHIQCAGIGSTVISYTGSSTIAAVFDIGTSATGSADQQTDSVEGCTINGGGHATDAIRTRGVHRSDFSHNQVLNVTEAGIHTNFGVVETINDFHVSTVELAMSTTPTNCMILDGPDSAHATTSAHLDAMACEGVTGDGVLLNDTNNIFIISGTSEGNGRCVNATAGALWTTLGNFDCEANTTEDVLANGTQMFIQNSKLNSTTKLHIGSTGSGVYVLGGAGVTSAGGFTIDSGGGGLYFMGEGTTAFSGTFANAVYDTAIQTLSQKTLISTKGIDGAVYFLDAYTAHNAQQLTGASITSAGSTVTCSSCTFTLADVGKAISLGIHGIGPSSGGLPLVSTIATFISATQVTTSATAGTTNLTGNNIVWGTPDATAINTEIAAISAAGGGNLIVPCSYSYIDATIQTFPNVNISAVAPAGEGSAAQDCATWFLAGNVTTGVQVGIGTTTQFQAPHITNLSVDDRFSQATNLFLVNGASNGIFDATMARGCNATGAACYKWTFGGGSTQASTWAMNDARAYDCTTCVDASLTNVDGPQIGGGEFVVKNTNTSFTGQPVGVIGSAVRINKGTHVIVGQNAGATQDAIGVECVNAGSAFHAEAKMEAQTVGHGIGYQFGATCSRGTAYGTVQGMATGANFVSGTHDNYLILIDSGGNNTTLYTDAGARDTICTQLGCNFERLNQTSANAFAGTATLAGGTVTVTFPSPGYNSAPVCTANDTTATNAVKTATSATVLTITGTGTDTIAYICAGNPN